MGEGLDCVPGFVGGFLGSRERGELCLWTCFLKMDEKLV
jgi:hypothetical protein